MHAHMPAFHPSTVVDMRLLSATPHSCCKSCSCKRCGIPEERFHTELFHPRPRVARYRVRPTLSWLSPGDYDISVRDTRDAEMSTVSLRARITRGLRDALVRSHPMIRSVRTVTADVTDHKLGADMDLSEILVDITFNGNVPLRKDGDMASFSVDGPGGSILELQPKQPPYLEMDLARISNNKGFGATVNTFTSNATVYHSFFDDDDEIQMPAPPVTGPFATTAIIVEGMNCIYCVSIMESGLRVLHGVTEVQGILGQPQVVRVRHSLLNVSVQKLREKIENNGFSVIEFETKREQIDVSVPIQEPSLLRTSLMIHGMTCASCVATLTKILKSLPGISEMPAPVVTLLPHQRAVVYHDPGVLAPETISARIEDAGFDVLDTVSVPYLKPQNANLDGRKSVKSSASVSNLNDGASPQVPPKDGNETTQTTTRFLIKGMTCSGCSVKVEQALKRKRGIVSVSVSLITNQAVIVHDPALIGPRDIIAEASNLGYAAEVDTGSSRDTKYREIQMREMRTLAIQTLIGFILALPTVVISMIIGMALPHHDPLRLALFRPFIPGLSIGILILTIIGTIVQFGLGWRFYVGSYKAITKTKAANMDVLIALGTSAAYFYSLVLVIIGLATGVAEEENFFETSILLIFFVILGKYLEVYAKGRTSDAVEALVKLTPPTAILIQHEASEKESDGFKVTGERQISIKLVQVGDILKVPAGARFPADGFIGEPMPVDKNPGDAVIGGSMNSTSIVLMKVNKAGNDTFVSQIARLVEDAQSKRAPIQNVADSISRIFVPAVLCIALVTFILWISFGRMITRDPATNFVSLSIEFAVAVLVVACPCALGLAVPTAVMVSTGVAARKNILVSGGGAAMQKMESIRCIAFDKTGTLTEGKALVAEVYLNPNVQSVFQEILHGMAKQWIRNHFGKPKMDGKERLDCRPSPSRFVVAAFGISDAPRESSVSAIRALQAAGIQVHMITGDSAKTAPRYCEKDWHSCLRPEEKSERVKGLKVQANLLRDNWTQRFLARIKLAEKSQVAFVGDGINDAVALAASDVGIAIGSGSEVAQDSASVILTRSNVFDVVIFKELSSLTMRRVRWNLMWALVYNLLGIPIAAGALYPFTKLVLQPWMAGLMMAASSVCVIGSSLLLKSFRGPKIPETEGSEIKVVA
ncbi:E1-E2 ATPase-domain-containing protein [Chytridium lagenaria]|nr:E1-E2 ATPase-domain-containing protein [Chytridium lagenaria]